MRRLTEHDRDDRGVVTLLVIIMIRSPARPRRPIDVEPVQSGDSSAQHSADATAMAVATDCVRSRIAAGRPAYQPAPQAGPGHLTRRHRLCGSGHGSGQDRERRRPVASCSTADGIGPQAGRRAMGNPHFRHHRSGRHLAMHLRSATAQRHHLPLRRLDHPLGPGGPACPGGPPVASDGSTGLTGRADHHRPQLQRTARRARQHRNGNVNHVGLHHFGRGERYLMVPIYGASCRRQRALQARRRDGNNNYYLILGFAEIQVTGWNSNRRARRRRDRRCQLPGTRQASCIQGGFVRFATQLGSTGTRRPTSGPAVYLSE